MSTPITVTLPAATTEVEALERLCREAREAANATRIVPKVGMILREKASGDVMRIASLGSHPAETTWTRLFPWDRMLRCCEARLLSTDTYDILPRYTIEGA